ncbi:hypothetical protein D3C72_2206010 [compost metagenome]
MNTGASRRGQNMAPTTAATAMPRKISSVRASATSHTANGLFTTGRAINGKV